jgi:2-amino-4-hydroxy-6-hydroxymethyldihydropteridine diphosphokinase
MSGYTHRIYLGIGSNISPVENFRRALHLLNAYGRLEKISRAWENPPIGSPGPYFLNAAAVYATDLQAEALKQQILRPIETILGRIRTSDRYAPRTIDLDIILADGILLDQHLWDYHFLAVPMADLLPDYRHPETQKSLAETAIEMRKHVLMTVSPETFNNFVIQETE